MISQNFINILKENTKIKEFFDQKEDFEIIIKKLSNDEIKRLLIEYPNLLEIGKSKGKNKVTLGTTRSIICFTVVKRNLDSKNYVKLRKFKVYFDELNGKIIKILKN